MMGLKSKKAQLTIGSVLSILLASYFVFFHHKPLAQVGDWKIYRQDVDYRDQIILLSFPNEKRSMGLYQLMKSAINLAILKNNGVSIQQTQVVQEENRIDQSTKNPEQLAKIKQIFGKDIEAYRRDFVLPTLVDHMIYYDFFLTNEKVHAESLHSAANFIQEASARPGEFSKIAAVKNLEVHKLVVSLKKGLIWDPGKNQLDPQKALASKTESTESSQENQEVFNRIKADMNKKSGDFDEEAKKWFDFVIKPIDVGEVAAAPISREEAWLVAKLTKKSNDVFELDVVSFPKLDFSRWYESEKSKVKISVQDKNYPIP